MPGSYLIDVRRGIVFSICCAAALPRPVGAAAGQTPSGELEIFKAWLDREHPGYGCDEGPARFQNETVESVYAGPRFYYVLTHARGIRPPFSNALSLVARVDESGEVRPLNPYSPESYRPGLKKVKGGEEARRTAAAVGGGTGVASTLYADLEGFAAERGSPLLALEINLRPENRPSLVFHERHRFLEIGRLETADGRLVSLRTRSTAPA